MSEIYDAIIIGGGQAGLATGYPLKKNGLHFMILEANVEPAGSWLQYYDSLNFHQRAIPRCRECHFRRKLN